MTKLVSIMIALFMSSVALANDPAPAAAEGAAPAAEKAPVAKKKKKARAAKVVKAAPAEGTAPAADAHAEKPASH